MKGVLLNHWFAMQVIGRIRFYWSMEVKRARIRALESQHRLESSCFSLICFGTLVAVPLGAAVQQKGTLPVTLEAVHRESW